MTTRSAVLVVAALVLAGLVGALPVAAAVAPDTGPTAGRTPVSGPVPPGQTFTDVALGTYHSLGVGVDGLVYAWGRNNGGQLGDGSTTDSPTPLVVPLPSGTEVTEVAAGVAFSAALTVDGQVYTWGNNVYGQLGDGTTTSSPTPVLAQLPSGVPITSIAVGYFHLIATAADGTVYAWGYNGSGQLGDGTTTTSSLPVVVQVPAGVAFTELLAAGYHSVALGTDGNVYSWGDNRDGELGDGTTTGSSVPVAALLPAGVTTEDVSTGYGFSVAAGSDGVLYAWGSGGYGQLGYGANASSSLPLAVSTPAGVTFSGMSSGEYHTVATGSDGQVYAWGRNQYGQLGIGTTADAWTPQVVAQPAGVVLSAFTAGFGHSSAIGSDGSTYTWGWNLFGQLGDGSGVDASMPVLAVADEVQVTAADFGGALATDLAQSAGVWTALTPAHTCGPVQVLVTASHSFGSRGTGTTTDGTFTYGTAPAVTQQPPVAVQVPASGGEVTLSAAADGDDAPGVQWQRSGADGSWADIPGATTTPMTISVTAPARFRAVFANCLGEASTASTSVTLAAPDPAPTPTPDPEPIPGPAPADGGSSASLARSGADGAGVLTGAALALVALGVVLRRIGRAEREVHGLPRSPRPDQHGSR